MSTLYVDIDETLIKWDDGAGFATKWEPNPCVINYVYQWWKAAKGPVVFWSTGGEDYARARVLECPITLSDEWAYESKWPRIPQPGDVFIDDDPLPSFKLATIHPRDLA